MLTHQPMAHLLRKPYTELAELRAGARVGVLVVDALQPPSFPPSCIAYRLIKKNSGLYFLWIITLKKPLVSRSPLVNLPTEILTVRF